jgi:hypothetical protein
MTVKIYVHDIAGGKIISGGGDLPDGSLVDVGFVTVGPDEAWEGIPAAELTDGSSFVWNAESEKFVKDK